MSEKFPQPLDATKEEVNKTESVLAPEKIENIDFAFQFKPELEELFGGDRELFQEYLDGIFPDSKVQDVLYHTSGAEKIEKPNVVNYNEGIQSDQYGFYMSDVPNSIYGESIHPVKINVSKGKELDALEIVLFKKGDYEELGRESVDAVYAAREKGEGEYDYSEIVIFEEDNIHVLGSEKDLEMASEFLRRKNVE
ncbi:hypothetical protein ACFL08_00395 [Patescibacteria group bacterium]